MPAAEKRPRIVVADLPQPKALPQEKASQEAPPW
jgi:hypothetical protein